MTSAVSWFNALQKRRANEVQEEFNRKQEELQQAQIRHGTFGAQLSAARQARTSSTKDTPRQHSTRGNATNMASNSTQTCGTEH